MPWYFLNWHTAAIRTQVKKKNAVKQKGRKKTDSYYDMLIILLPKSVPGFSRLLVRSCYHHPVRTVAPPHSSAVLLQNDNPRLHRWLSSYCMPSQAGRQTQQSFSRRAPRRGGKRQTKRSFGTKAATACDRSKPSLVFSSATSVLHL